MMKCVTMVITLVMKMLLKVDTVGYVTAFSRMVDMERKTRDGQNEDENDQDDCGINDTDQKNSND